MSQLTKHVYMQSFSFLASTQTDLIKINEKKLLLISTF
jgi:hypothetical protein